MNSLQDKGYKTILADPPWAYKNKNTGGSMNSGSNAKYPIMSMDELCKLPIKDIADKNSILFLWATTPLLPEAFEVMKTWGYKYKTAIYWKKTGSLGLGFWFRGGVEICLLGIRGKVKAFRCQKPNFIQSKARQHSRKPMELIDLIDQYSPKPRIELFAREQYTGWDSWGNETNKFLDNLSKQVKLE